MNKKLFALFLALTMILSLSGFTACNSSDEEEIPNVSLYDPSKDHEIILTDFNPRRRSGSSVILNLNRLKQDWTRLNWKAEEDSSAVIWEWSRPGTEFCGVKYRELPTGEQYVLAVDSVGQVFVIDYRTVEVEYRLADDGGTRSTDPDSLYNAHSAEMLPNGDIIVACSGYGEGSWNYENGGLRYFKQSGSSYVLKSTLSLPFAHAILWDPSEECLWSVGYEGIVAVDVDSDMGTMEKNEEKSLSESYFTGHDMVPVYGKDGQFYVSDSGSVYLFDVAAKTLTRSSDYSLSNVKGIAQFDDGTVITSNWTNYLYVYQTMTQPDKRGNHVQRIPIAIGNDRDTQIYKVNTCTPKYE